MAQEKLGLDPAGSARYNASNLRPLTDRLTGGLMGIPEGSWQPRFNVDDRPAYDDTRMQEIHALPGVINYLPNTPGGDTAESRLKTKLYFEERQKKQDYTAHQAWRSGANSLADVWFGETSGAQTFDAGVNLALLPVGGVTGAKVVGKGIGAAAKPVKEFVETMTGKIPVDKLADYTPGSIRQAPEKIVERWNRFRVENAPPILYDKFGNVTGSSIDPDWTEQAYRKLDDLLLRTDYGRETMGRLALKEGVKDFAIMNDLSPARGGQYLVDSLGNPLGKAGEYGFNTFAAKRAAMFYRLGHGNKVDQAQWDGLVEELLPLTGGDREAAEMLPRLWGATSPHTDVVKNSREALLAWNWTLKNPGKLMTQGQVKKLKITLSNAKWQNINQAIMGLDLNGEKVRAMLKFMLDQPNLPIDVHALRAVTGNNRLLTDMLPELQRSFIAIENIEKQGGKVGLDPIEDVLMFRRQRGSGRALTPEMRRAPSRAYYETYGKLEKALKDTLQSLDPSRNINEIFAQYWEGSRRASGLPWVRGPIELYRDLGLLDLARKANPGLLKEFLRKHNWSKLSIAALMGGIAQTDPNAAPDWNANPNEPLPNVYG
jgi:hypothetical protein